MDETDVPTGGGRFELTPSSERPFSDSDSRRHPRDSERITGSTIADVLLNLYYNSP
jgi:hypothetical protein